MAARRTADQLRAATQLLVDAATGVTSVVEDMHATIASGPAVLGAPLARPAKAVTGLVYGGIRGVTKAVGRSLDVALAKVGPLLGDLEPLPEQLALIAALNGVVGDFLVARQNPLATPMSLCREGVPLELTKAALRKRVPEPSPELLVLVHGSSMNDLQWARHGHDHGTMLEAHGGFSAVYARYNSGLHVSTNGAEFAALLGRLIAAWPVKVRRVVFVGHSMGGLVTRAAWHSAQVERLGWLGLVDAAVFLGTPHHGAPLERGGHWFETFLGVSRYSAPLAALGKIRSEGVTDLRYGNVRDEDWRGHDRFHWSGDRRHPLPLPTHIDCGAVAASLSPKPTAAPRSDGLVPVDSALGISRRPDACLAFAPERQKVVFGANHLDLLSHREVSQLLKKWLG